MPREDTQFKKGNPGRKIGSKNKFASSVWDDLAEIHAEGGREALVLLRDERPEIYWGIVAKLMPKDMQLSLEPIDTEWTINFIKPHTTLPYDPGKTPKQAAWLCRAGISDRGLADFFNVDLETHEEWKVEYPDYFKAVSEARTAMPALPKIEKEPVKATYDPFNH